MSCASVGVPITPIRLLRAAACGGYFPGMHQPALRADFAPSLAKPDSMLVALVEEGIAAIIPGYVSRELAGSGGAQPLVALVAGMYEALLDRVGIPLLCSSRMLAVCGPGEETVVYLPMLDHSAYGPYLEGLNWAVSLVNTLLVKGDVNKLSPGLARVLGQLTAVAPSGMNSRRFIEEAHRLGIPWRKVAGNVYRFGIGSRARLFDSSFTDSTPFIGAQLARDKRLTAQVLNASGLPGPRHQQVLDGDEAVAVAERLGYPVVVKPANEDGGRGVFAGLVNADMVRRAFAQASVVSSQILVEKHFEGNDYRLQVLHDEVYWIVNRIPGGVTGDGVHSVAELLAELNAHPLRGPRESNALLKIIELDEEALEMLDEVSLSQDLVPAEGQFVRLRRASNVAAGGIPVPALEGAHPDNMELAVRAARLLRLDVAGIDLIIPDIRESWLDTGALICEVNAQPQLYPHLPAYLLEKLVAGDGRVPVTVILGGAPDWAWDVAQTLNGSGSCVGILSPDGVHVGGRRVMGVPASVYQGCEAIFNDSTIDCAILCLSDDQLVKSGFPIDRFDRLVLVEPETVSEVDQWQKLYDCASFLAELCGGEILLAGDSGGWNQVLDRLPSDRVGWFDSKDLLSGLVTQLSGDIS